jgi:hypothetical protein
MKRGAGNHVNAIKSGLTHLGKLFLSGRYILVLTNKNDYHMELAAKVELQSLDLWHCTRNFRNHHLQTLYLSR